VQEGATVLFAEPEASLHTPTSLMLAVRLPDWNTAA
jgi:hypothetical protein